MNEIKCLRPIFTGDPEVGIVDGTTVVPACLILPDKEHGILTLNKPTPGQYGVCRVYHDGRAAEYQRPWSEAAEWSTCQETMLYLDRIALNLICNKINEHNRTHGTKYDVFLGAGGYTTHNLIEQAGEAAWRSGCNQVMNAYTELPNDSIPHYKKHLGVYFGNHIHVQPFKPHTHLFKDWEHALAFVKLAMLVSVIPCKRMVRDPMSAERTKYCGFAGSFRMKPYGIEILTHDSSMLAAPALQYCVYSTMRLAYFIHTNDLYKPILPILSKEDKIIRAINTNDRDLLDEIWEELKPVISEYAEYDDHSVFSDRDLYKAGQMSTRITPMEIYERICDGLVEFESPSKEWFEKGGNGFVTCMYKRKGVEL